jgi:hypothetical protein
MHKESPRIILTFGDSRSEMLITPHLDSRYACEWCSVPFRSSVHIIDQGRVDCCVSVTVRSEHGKMLGQIISLCDHQGSES